MYRNRILKIKNKKLKWGTEKKMAFQFFDLNTIFPYAILEDIIITSYIL